MQTTQPTATATLDFPSAVDYVRRTVHVADLKIHRVSSEHTGVIDVDFDFSPDAAGALGRLSGRMSVWALQDGQLYGEW